MDKIIEPKKLHNDTPVSLREWIELKPKYRSDNEPDAYEINYDYIKQEYKDDMYNRLKIEEMRIGHKFKISFNHFLIRVK